jgi:flagellar basal-body rod protein FlgB
MPANAKRLRRPDSMDLFNIALFHRLTERMNWLGAREKVIATNIANSDTPSYQPKDVVPLDFGDHLKKLAAVEPQRTDKKHMVGTMPPADPVDSKRQKKTYETAPAGNSVVVEEQMMKLSQTQADYNQIINLYRKHVDMLKTAIGRGV